MNARARVAQKIEQTLGRLAAYLELLAELDEQPGGADPDPADDREVAGPGNDGPTDWCPVPNPSANGVRPGTGCASAAKARERRLAVARLLAAGPLRQSEISDRAGIPTGSLTALLAHEWFQRAVPDDRFSPYALTDAGREAVRGE
jgi:hypothetical protein